MGGNEARFRARLSIAGSARRQRNPGASTTADARSFPNFSQKLRGTENEELRCSSSFAPCLFKHGDRVRTDIGVQR